MKLQTLAHRRASHVAARIYLVFYDLSSRVSKKPHSTEFSGGTCHCSSKASRGKDLEVEEPVSCWDFASFHFHATLAGLQGPTLIRDEVVQVGEPGEKRLLASTRMMEPLHREELPLNGVMGLV